MSFTEKNFFNLNNETNQSKVESETLSTPENLRKFADWAIKTSLKKFSLEGLDSLREFKKENPDQKFIISSSHSHNADLPAALKALGNDFNIQVTGESLLLSQLKYLDKRLLINKQFGRDNFTALDYKDTNKGGKRGSFNPENFKEIAEKMNEGKTPWIAAQPFSPDGSQKKHGLGAVYLAAKEKAAIIPTALEIKGGGSKNLEGPIENIKGLLKRSEGVYHIGQPLEFPDLDISIIDDVFAKRQQGIEIKPEELEKFTTVHQELKTRASMLLQEISGLYPQNDKLK